MKTVKKIWNGKLVAVLAGLVLCALVFPGMARAEMTLGVVDFTAVADSHPDVKQLKQNLMKLEMDFEQEVDSFIKTQLELPDDWKEKQESLPEETLMEIQKIYIAAGQQFEQQVAALRNPVLAEVEGKILVAVESVCKAKGIDMMVEKSSVLFGGTDYTQDVIVEVEKTAAETPEQPE